MLAQQTFVTRGGCACAMVSVDVLWSTNPWNPPASRPAVQACAICPLHWRNGCATAVADAAVAAVCYMAPMAKCLQYPANCSWLQRTAGLAAVTSCRSAMRCWMPVVAAAVYPRAAPWRIVDLAL